MVFFYGIVTPTASLKKDLPFVTDIHMLETDPHSRRIPLATRDAPMSDGQKMTAYRPDLQQQPEPGPGGSGPRLAMIAMAGLLVLGGGASWLTNHRASPETSPVTHSASQQPMTGGGVSAAGQFTLISPDNAARALQKAGYSTDEQTKILAGINRRDYRLVVMPIFDASGAGGTVSVQSGPITRVVTLTPEPQEIVLPIVVSGDVTFTPLSNPGVHGIQVGGIMVSGPEAFPVIHQDESLTVTVIAQ
ncbi:hypothetical protein AA0472_0367 [Acetobacter estunensis NRIC 0472]|uniref:Uncharacterized protein n=1 Tax=Acetobacter estunensis TaxID=104097 RepID=A0A967EDH8_9PROT|nr:hypothetical protein [Acetobacter estunensis]NHO54306.1 hypothetical protein [Acetobacter estunensis]GBQ21180.1 hypothetical protein AA0472_0367 [Acetobacter estunensis NRIC 0472]